MSWVFPLSEAVQTTRQGVASAAACTGSALLVAGAATAVLLSTERSGTVPWLSLAGFAVALATLVAARRFLEGPPMVLAGVLVLSLAAVWLNAAGLTGLRFDGFIGFPLFTTSLAASLTGAIVDRWTGAVGTMIGCVASQALIAVAYLGLQPLPDTLDPAAIATAGVVAAFFLLLRVFRRRGRSTSKRFDEIGSRDLAAGERLALRLRSRALLHDTVLGELVALGMSRPGPLPESMSRSIRASLLAVANPAEHFVEALSPAVAFAESMERFRIAGLRVVVTGDAAAVDALTASTRAPLLLAIEQCLVNVLQHSGVEGAELSVAHSDSRLVITVVDEGRGFDERSVPADRFGLRESVRGRVESLGGTVRVLSGAGNGTSIVLSIPVVEALR